MEVSKEVHVKFQAECVSNVYMLKILKVIAGGLQLSSASEAVVVELSETMMNSNLDVQLYPKKRLGLGVQQESPDRYSYGGENFHKYCVDQEDCWVIKFCLGLNLIDLIKL